jgi:TetR/AcrR family fatty acid metabolism transcriptional regulator
MVKDWEGSKTEKRKVIIEAAFRVFSTAGFHKARMESIAEIAGIGKGTLYEYFPSKLDLFKETLLGSFSYYNELTESGDEGEPIADRLYQLFWRHVEACRRYQQLGEFLFREQESLGEEFETWFHDLTRQSMRKLQVVLQKAVDDGELRPVDMSVLSTVIVGIKASLMLLLHSSPEITDEVLERNTRDALDILLHGISSLG